MVRVFVHSMLLITENLVVRVYVHFVFLITENVNGNPATAT